jgi:hypothetical protein
MIRGTVGHTAFSRTKSMYGWYCGTGTDGRYHHTINVLPFLPRRLLLVAEREKKERKKERNGKRKERNNKCDALNEAISNQSA